MAPRNKAKKGDFSEGSPSLDHRNVVGNVSGSLEKQKKKRASRKAIARLRDVKALDPFRTAVLLRGQNHSNFKYFVPKRDWGRS